jgi:hypothetical protein
MPAGENPAPPSPSVASRLYPLTDVWFQTSRHGCRLLMAADTPGVETEICVEMTAGVIMRLRHIDNIKGRRIFEAIEWDPADDHGVVASDDPLVQLQGPFRAGLQDAE